MEYARQTVDSNILKGILNIPPTLYNKKVEVIILPIEDTTKEQFIHANKRQIGFWDGPEIPDSFFEPLPEEELQAWGL